MESSRIYLGGVTLTRHTAIEALESIVQASQRGKVLSVVTPNAYHLYLAKRNRLVQSALQGADISVPDGWPVAWLSKKFNDDSRGRIAGSDLSTRVLSAAAQMGKRVLIVGGTQAARKAAVANAQEAYNGLSIYAAETEVSIPTYPTSESTSQLIATINRFKADVVLLCLGAPKSELHLSECRAYLAPGAYLCVGATVDFLAKHKVRAPAWVQRIRMEWFFRLLQEPGRLFRRYIRSGQAVGSTYIRELSKRVRKR